MKKYFLIICSLFALSGAVVYGQEDLKNDLLKKLKNFELVKFNEKLLAEKAKTKQPIQIRAYGRVFEFVLTPNDLRAAGYQAVETTETGERELPPSEVTTFKGKLTGDFDSEVRFSFAENATDGLIYTGDNKKFFVTKAEKFSRHADADDLLVYSEDDLPDTINLSDDVLKPFVNSDEKQNTMFETLKSYIFGAPESLPTNDVAAPSLSPTNLRVLEIATDADFQWVTQTGGAAAANSEILRILNLVDGIYQRDLNLTIRVTFQNAWSTQDPYSSGTIQNLLESFRVYWNTNFPPTRTPRDTAHLFTNKFSNQGLAYLGVVCNSPSYAYGLTGRSSGNLTHLITAHEIGHNLNADHVDQFSSCNNTIMISVLNSSVTGFCETSKTQISNFVATNNSCLSLSGAGTPTPTPTPAQAFSISGTVFYFTNPTNQTFRPVPNVLLSVSGTVASSAFTDSNGNYTVVNLPANGRYTVTPSKSGDINGVSPLDPTLVLRYTATGGQGSSALNANQLIAADASGDGGVSALDATLILRYIAQGRSSNETGLVGTWRFVPSQRIYAQLLSSQTNQNYEAILMGDVNGSWSPTGAFAE